MCIRDRDCTYVEGASPFKKVVSFTEAVEKGLYNAAEEDDEVVDEEVLEEEDIDDLVSSEAENEEVLENESDEIDEEIDEEDEYIEDVEFSVEELEQMNIGELTTIAKEMGIDVKKLKKKEQLIEAIISAQDSANEDEEIEDEEIEEVEDIVEDEPIDGMERIERELQNYSEEELADILNSVGITPRG
ncbi:MAG: Rho termination factor N-terminal domain-containing protein, partial [Patescibacteria group bacterium]|nr:Rho termination factor N-terminal domain-containing protein [Patescibacteria group bacterium]